MCAPVSVSMAPALTLAGIIPAIVISVLSGLAGIVLTIKGLVARGG
jgi:hypothetical protein